MNILENASYVYSSIFCSGQWLSFQITLKVKVWADKVFFARENVCAYVGRISIKRNIVSVIAFFLFVFFSSYIKGW